MQSTAQNVVVMNIDDDQVSQTETKLKTFVSKIQKLKDIRKRMKDILLEETDERVKIKNKG